MHDPDACLHRLADLAGIQVTGRMPFDWGVIERDLGLRLPADYKLLAECLPPGWFRKFARLESPERTDGWPRGCFFLDEFGEQVLESVREWRANGDPVPYPVYPEPGGLLLWGGIESGGYAFWVTDPAKEPENWPVVIASQIGEVWARFDGPVCDFLTEVAAARFDTTGFTTGPVNVVAGRKTASPVVLSARPVFEPDAPPVPPPPVVARERRVPDSGFWASRQQHFPRPPVSEMAVLRELLGAPPAKVASVDWGQVRSRLGTGLPADYREFIDTYGPGRLGDLRIMAPGAPDDWDLFALLQRKYEQVRYLERNSAGGPPFHPEPGGTISWGETADGWTCCWAPAEADPDAWNVVALMPTPNPARLPAHRRRLIQFGAQAIYRRASRPDAPGPGTSASEVHAVPAGLSPCPLNDAFA